MDKSLLFRDELGLIAGFRKANAPNAIGPLRTLEQRCVCRGEKKGGEGAEGKRDKKIRESRGRVERTHGMAWRLYL